MDNRINGRSDLQEIIGKNLKSMAEDAGSEFDLAWSLHGFRFGVY